jgi:hypothetical protein
MDSDILGFAQVMTVIVLSLGAITMIVLAARAVWMRGSARPPALRAAKDEERTQRLESAVEAIAIEVERISEAQRYMVSLLSESAALRRGESAGELMAPPASGRSVTPH